MVVSIKQQILLVLSLLIMMFSLLAGVVNGQLYANSIMFSKVVHPKSSIEKEQLMIIVGEVTDTTVRILYEWAPLYSVKDVSPDLDDLNLYLDVKKRIDSILGSKNVKMYKNTKNDFEFIYLMMTEQERLEWTRKHTSQWKIVLRKTETRTVVNGKDIIGQVVEIRDREGPKVLQFDSLTPNTCYTVEFVRLDGNIEDNEEYATFCTVSTDPFSLTSNIRISAMSCNRLFEDHDTTTYDEFFIEHQDSLWDFVIHMGDQVYADWVYHEYFKKINPQASFDDLLNAFRYVYRNTWKIHAVQRMLRHGSHLMIPDDHDIINNLDSWMLTKESDEAMKRMVLAGKEAFYEYQYQLLKDVLIGSKKQELVSNSSVYYFRDLGFACLALLDLRFERTFNNDPESPLFGTKQLNDLKQFLSRCMNNENRSIKIKRALIFTSIPLLFFGEGFSKVIYTAERERYSTHQDFKQDVTKFLDYLDNTYGTYRIVFVAGDIHQFLMTRICKSQEHCFEQMITSGMTIQSTVGAELKIIFANLIDRFFFSAPSLGDWQLLRKTNLEDISTLQHSIRRNYGIIEMKPDGNVAFMRGVQSKYASRREIYVQDYMFDRGSIYLILTLFFLSGIVFPISMTVFIFRIIRFLFVWCWKKQKKE
ncbi:hypothetical protein FDP41_009321 [Naegleria fowleri]|uniref:PhoD-like phosphatase metallophosphatase domain-containing protein n=1 Tax=Naegleria fowleri TaxID=5763 RepID=A0A6A5BES2_NAEFO|nr:uncharacterized protein FDP41_009321 [Naegleria fowleri]KAF0972418.1 hypothetical protein FDP41_009321 [Naegleria fowleri]CAG4709869.1 unnamed protein product [Naegleria fowleri]